MVITMGLVKTKSGISHATAEVNRTGHPETMMKNSRPWVTISPTVMQNGTDRDAVDVAIGFMNEYADTFE